MKNKFLYAVFEKHKVNFFYIEAKILDINIATRKEIVSIHELFSNNFWNMSTIAGWSFTVGTDIFRGVPGCG